MFPPAKRALVALAHPVARQAQAVRVLRVLVRESVKHRNITIESKMGFDPLCPRPAVRRLGRLRQRQIDEDVLINGDPFVRP